MKSHAAATLASLFVAAASPIATAQSTANPAARASITTPRVAQQNRLPLQRSEATASGASPFAAGCGDANGTVYIGAEVEPHVAVDPLNPDHLVGVWQQDRYSNGAARGLATATSFDGGASWTSSPPLPVSTCTGGEYSRATDPWVSFAPDGTVHQTALGVSGEAFTPTGASAILVSRSGDGGRTWAPPITLIRDPGDFFNDKQTITADPFDARFVYAVWDRILSGAGGPTMFSRSTDGGLSWEMPARAIHDPGPGRQTIGNLVRVLPGGTLVNLLTHIDSGAPPTINVIRSSDHGATWSSPILVSTLGALGARDPTTGSQIRDGSIIAQMAAAPDGTLYVVWQDARFTTVRDAIALSRSIDGGRTWSTPVRVNFDPQVIAFTPQVHVRADGLIGVTYYDLRSDSADRTTLMADFWLARSADGIHWTETRVSPAFDLSTAPLAGGLFLGDYTGLVSAGNTFISFYARTTGVPSNRTDVIAARIGPAAGAPVFKRDEAEEPAVTYRAEPLPEREPGPEFWEAVEANAVRAMERRIPGWTKAMRPRS